MCSHHARRGRTYANCGFDTPMTHPYTVYMKHMIPREGHHQHRALHTTLTARLLSAANHFSSFDGQLDIDGVIVMRHLCVCLQHEILH